MQVTREHGQHGGTTYAIEGLNETQIAMLGALADFPQWNRQPDDVAAFCTALHKATYEALPLSCSVAANAEAFSMTDSTTV
jgi:hypothetical protein